MRQSWLAALALGVLLTGCQRGLREARNKEIVRLCHQEVWSEGKLDLIDDVYAEDFICHFPIGPEWRGRAEVRDHVVKLRTGFPDWNERIIRLIAQDDFVVTRSRMSGTNKGEFLGSPATGRCVEFDEFIIFRLEDGKIAEHWNMPDLLRMHTQLGLIQKLPSQREDR